MDSILKEIKQLCNVDAADANFDADIILHINTDFAKLYQLKAGPDNGFAITGATETWDQFTDDLFTLAFSKAYIQASCRIKFDPPTNSTLMDALRQQMAEAEWRLQMHTEGYV